MSPQVHTACSVCCSQTTSPSLRCSMGPASPSTVRSILRQVLTEHRSKTNTDQNVWQALIKLVMLHPFCSHTHRKGRVMRGAGRGKGGWLLASWGKQGAGKHGKEKGCLKRRCLQSYRVDRRGGKGWLAPVKGWGASKHDAAFMHSQTLRPLQPDVSRPYCQVHVKYIVQAESNLPG